jgi:hypothetical protein
VNERKERREKENEGKKKEKRKEIYIKKTTISFQECCEVTR